MTLDEAFDLFSRDGNVSNESGRLMATVPTLYQLEAAAARAEAKGRTHEEVTEAKRLVAGFFNLKE